MKYFKNGYSLMELMIVVAVIAILITLSYPSYVSFIRKSNRAEAMVVLLDWANRQDIWRADNASYNTGINPSDDELYAYSIVTATSTSYTLTATAQGAQAYDEEKDVSCSSITVNQAGVTGPVGYEDCWNH